MITVYLLNNTTQKYKYNIIEYKDYGEFIENVVKQIKQYIFSIDNIIITINDEIIKLNEVDLTDNINSNEMTEINIYERKRDEKGNVCESKLVNKYLKWKQYKEDCQLAKDLEESMNNSSPLNYLNNLISTQRRMFRNNRTPNSLPPLPSSITQSPPPPPSDTNQFTDYVTDQLINPDSNSEVETSIHFVDAVYDFSNETFPTTTDPSNSTDPEVSTPLLNINNLTLPTVLPQINSAIPPYTLPPPTTNFLEFIGRRPPQQATSLSSISLPIQPPRPIQLSQQILTTFIENIGSLNTGRLNTDYSLTLDELEDMTDVKVVLDDDGIGKCRKCTFKDLKDDGEINIVEKCNFTLEEFKDDSEVLCLPCGHYFMSAEITEWLTEHSHKCPVCRKEVGKGNVL